MYFPGCYLIYFDLFTIIDYLNLIKQYCKCEVPFEVDETWVAFKLNSQDDCGRG